jgi:thiol reductant ABC exporter CydD subunit
MAALDRRLLRASRAARRQLHVASALAVLAALLVVAQAVLLADAIARAFLDGASVGDLRGTLIALAAVLVARAVVAAGFELAGRRGAQRAMGELRAALARQLLVARPMRPAERTGELATAAVQGVDALEAYLAGYVPQLLLAATVPLAVLAWVLPHDPLAAALLALGIPLLVVFMVLIGRSAVDAARGRQRALSLLGAHFLDVVRGLETLRAHDRDGAQADAMAAVGERYRVETMATLRIAFLSALVLELVATIGTALVAAAIGLQLVSGTLSLSVGLCALILAPELYGPLREVGRQFHASADGLAAFERIQAVLAAPPTVIPTRSLSRPVPDPARDGLRFAGVSFAYDERPGLVLDDLDLELRPGELTALVGPSGAGKSTVAALALRLADPTAGSVACGGVDLRDVDPEAWRARCAWVPQRARLFAGTVAENVRLADPSAPTARVAAALRNAGADFAFALPDGMETPIGDGGRRLSAGEGQRIALARAFLRNAGLLVLDEPTAQLDAETAASIDDALVRLAAGRTTLLIVHRPSLAARADRVIELRAGRAVAPALPRAPARAEAVA